MNMVISLQLAIVLEEFAFFGQMKRQKIRFESFHLHCKHCKQFFFLIDFKPPLGMYFFLPFVNYAVFIQNLLTYDYRFYAEFQSHDAEFDSLTSCDIEERINAIQWCKSSNNALFLLATNGTIAIRCFI